MLTRLLISIVLLAGSFAFASDETATPPTDLTLPGERWITGFNGYLCGNKKVDATPQTYQELNVQFERLSTDRTMRNGIIVATFTENDVTCRYSALVKANLETKIIEVTKSVAYAPSEGSECSGGKYILDRQLRHVDYIFYGNPNHLALQLPFADASEICGEGSLRIGVDFILKQKIDTP